MRKWLWCVTTLCLAALLAGCGEEEPKTPLDWVAIDPEATEEQRRILSAGLEIIFAECPALAAVDWEAVAKKTGNFALHINKPARFYKSHSQNTPSRPLQIVMSKPDIDSWTHFGAISADSDDMSIGWSIRFSWTEPPGIATQAREDPAKDAKKKKYATLTRSARGRAGASTGSSGSMPWRRS
jgi:hypothetical protein